MTEQWSGSLAPRKKGELLDLSHQLGLQIDASATKPEILDALRTYIEANETILIEDARFKGLYGRKASTRKGSAPPQEESDGASPGASVVVTRRRRGTLQTHRRSTSPSKNLPPFRGADVDLPVTPSRIALPASPAHLLSSAVARIRPDLDGVVVNVNRTAEQFSARRDKALATTRKFLSSSPNIAILSVIWEFITLLYAFIPTVTEEITIPPLGSSSPFSFGLSHPPAAIFLSKELYILIAAWAVPTIILPVIFGYLISFQGPSGVDLVSSGIVRLVCAVSPPWDVPEDFLSSKTRVISAATALSFAVAEALSRPSEQRVQSKPARRYLTAS